MINVLGRFLEGKVGTWIVLIVAHVCLPLVYFAPSVGALILSYVGLVIPQIMLYRQAQLARAVVGEKEDD